MNKKEAKRLEALETKASNCEHLTSEEIRERNELQFKRNKQNIFMRLNGRNKYYYAYECWSFTKHIMKDGFQQYKAKDIKSISIVNCQYYGASIKARLTSGGETNLRTFNDRKEMLGFIIGFNACAGCFQRVWAA